ncbi:MAG: long-chain fatty acid--CoA ligase [Thermoanaerobaculales bacterium]|nr:long-chain fatty acid--CoA ligase [Thermoanaerobaculales bacterium]
MRFVDFENVHAMLSHTVERSPDRTAYTTILPDGGTESRTWSEFAAEVRQVGKSLIALGVGKDDKANIVSYSCYRWVLTDIALASIGSVTVGIYHSLLAKDIGYIVEHSDAVLVFAEDPVQAAKLVELRDRLPAVRKVVLFKGPAPSDDGWTITYEDFLEFGRDVADEALDARIADVGPADVAAIVYTSGTTGVPKGAVLTHDNITFTAQSVFGSASIHADDIALLFLPLAHIFARTCVFTALFAGCTTVFARAIDTIADDFKIARPHWFPSVPRIYEKVHSKILAGAQAKGGVALKLFNWACAVGDRVSDHLLAKQPIPLVTRLQYALATKLVFSKVQAALGGRVRWCISGAAPLDPSIGKFFHAAGVLILEGIGMTENTSFTNVNREDDYRFGWVGPTGPGIEQKTAADGEVLYRGRNVMREYYKMPEETAETITPDGWQHTGDLGEIDDVGFLKITGRKKDLIVTAGGKNVAPSAIEGLVATSPYISQVCVIGDRRRYLTALITVDEANIRAFATERGLAAASLGELLARPEVRQLIHGIVEEKNRELASFETIKDFRLLEEFSIENGLLTPTLKVKRNVAMERFADLIEEMYAET